jgi:hypothetical protein
VPWGTFYRTVVERSGVSMAVTPLATGLGGFYRASTNTLTMSSQLVQNEDVKIVATVLGHELTHVAQSLRGMDGTGACVDREVEAMQNEMVALVILFDGLPPGGTTWQRAENQLVRVWLNEGDPGLYRLVVTDPAYQKECALWVP